MMSGFEFLRCAFAAMVTAVSVMPWLSFAMVFPVQGAIMSASIGFAGPSGSASAMEQTGFAPHNDSRRDKNRRLFRSVCRSLPQFHSLWAQARIYRKAEQVEKKLIICAVRAAEGYADAWFCHDIKLLLICRKPLNALPVPRFRARIGRAARAER